MLLYGNLWTMKMNKRATVHKFQTAHLKYWSFVNLLFPYHFSGVGLSLNGTCMATGCDVIHSMHTFAVCNWSIRLNYCAPNKKRNPQNTCTSTQCSNTQCTKYTMHGYVMHRPVTFGRMSKSLWGCQLVQALHYWFVIRIYKLRVA